MVEGERYRDRSGEKVLIVEECVLLAFHNHGEEITEIM